ncbi:hypothetical protein V8G54_002255 [Vigna mungo]|uniref:Uncharacterized protein n=1 Tax=Vigna mungo TaxID=3915 RepID=A0AAQ3P7S2_VIGMU
MLTIHQSFNKTQSNRLTDHTTFLHAIDASNNSKHFIHNTISLSPLNTHIYVTQIALKLLPTVLEGSKTPQNDLKNIQNGHLELPKPSKQILQHVGARLIDLL